MRAITYMTILVVVHNSQTGSHVFMYRRQMDDDGDGVAMDVILHHTKAYDTLIMTKEWPITALQ